ncbi:DUF5689 domain-containing protein [Sediminicola luteus]|uniref:LTD domain-containing protein n=1 Tax=Sediminicola luteus TaxID=319238 RepID=A0A2A4G516_9FLAO|nr:DUF5689 domain-containing protein [Sediminicola luteus]PCE62832.1 hypothetical protein B7P33_16260 [Sediminicola luteus]
MKYGRCILMVYLMLVACDGSQDLALSEVACDRWEVNTTMADIKAQFVGETLKLTDSLVFEGYVSSSDRAGNFFSVLHLQDTPQNPTHGIALEVDLRESHLFYPEGTKVLVNARGMYLGQSKGLYSLGGTFQAFGNLFVGRLPFHAIDDHIQKACEPINQLTPTVVKLSQLEDAVSHSLVRFEGLEIVAEERDSLYAFPREETLRHLLDCEGKELVLVNSGYAEFQADSLPRGNGSITGVFLMEKNQPQLIIRDVADVAMDGLLCSPKEISSVQVFISELADPNNDTGARFVELYNASDMPIALDGWQLQRYTNANTEVSSTLDLTGYVIAAQATLVISPNPMVFEAIYGFAPDMAAGKNSPADSNGDDNLFLIDPFGVVIDAFGRIGEDGTGTDHEFEDGRAFRKIDIVAGNAEFDPSEWIIHNDSGGNGTVNEPKNAPADFSPGSRE